MLQVLWHWRVNPVFEFGAPGVWKKLQGQASLESKMEARQMEIELYLEQLTGQLQRRGVAEERIGEVIRELHGRFEEGHEAPEDVLGPAARYAEELASSDELRRGKSSEDKWHKRTFMASAYDEMDILESAGSEGWELMNVGLLTLNCRRPEDLEQAQKWEYKRRTGVSSKSLNKEMAQDNWEPCGIWVVLHYFKRTVGALGSEKR